MLLLSLKPNNKQLFLPSIPMAGTFPTKEDLCITRWQNWSDAWQTLPTGQENAVHTKKEVKELNLYTFIMQVLTFETIA